MTTRLITKPAPHQHPAWSSVYIDKLPDDGQVLAHLASGLEDLLQTIEPLTEEKLLYRYDEGKWTIKEVLVHLMDAERVFTYRGLRCSRHDKTPMPGFDHNAYVPVSGANERDIKGIIAEYRALRAATIAFFSHLTDEALNEVGEASTLASSGRAMVYMIAGHERHHLQIIKERYLD
ncbi:MAG: DinB family protein [Bacteroidota bacterium]